MTHYLKLPKKYWLVFRRGEHWTQFFLKKGFGHIFILTRDDYNWYCIDPDIKQFGVKILSENVKYFLPKLYANSELKVLEVETNNINRSFFGNFSILYCVSMIKYALGIQVCAFTPWGLYRRLLRMYRTKRYIGGVKDVKTIF